VQGANCVEAKFLLSTELLTYTRNILPVVKHWQKIQASKRPNSPTKASIKEKMEPLRTKPSTSHMKQINQRKKEEIINPIKLLA
jgi:hypothetical protein